MAPSSTPPPHASREGSGGWGAPLVFAPGTLVAERYRIERFLARGGMGEVYEALDTVLSERVALKTVRTDADEGALERLKREITLTRHVTHPNVCRAFDVVRHYTPDGDEVLCFTMELLHGENLAERLARDGRFTPAAALPLIAEMARALDAAHAAGVVHRDFKSANVMLVAADACAPAPRQVVVTDFGQALSHRARGKRVTQSGVVMGTPAYLAPEQVEGRPVTPAADIYSLGVVAYEMVTGALPFEAEGDLAVAMRRLDHPPIPPRARVPGLDTGWERALLRCLARHEEERFARAGDFVRALRGEKVPAARRVRLRRAAPWLAALLGAAGVATAGLVWLRMPAAPAPSSAGSPPPLAAPRRSVAVLGFRNLSRRPEVGWLSAAFTEMLSTEVALSSDLRAVPGEAVQRAATELHIEPADGLERAALDRLQRNVGADLVVVGGFVAEGGEAERRLRLDVRVQQVSDGNMAVAFAEEGTEAGLLELVARAGARLRGGLGAASSGRAASRPRTPEAARLHAEGLALARRFELRSARDALLRAVQADDQWPMAHLALADVWTQLGYDGQAREHARRAFELSGALDREERLLVEGRHREAGGEWTRATDVYRTLWTSFPDELEYGLRLARAETSAGHPRQALETLGTLRRLGAPAGDDPRIDLAESETAQALSDHQRQRSAAAAAARKAEARGATLLRARARLAEGWALRNLSDEPGALAATEDARKGFEASGESRGAARAVLNIGVLHYDAGRFAEARGWLDRALAISRRIGDVGGQGRALNNIALVLTEQGRFPDARAHYEQALALFGEGGDRPAAAMARNNIANLLAQEGRLAEALAAYEQARAAFAGVGQRSGEALALGNIAWVLSRQGQLREAQAKYEEALAVWRELGEKRHTAFMLAAIGEVMITRGELGEARRRQQEALELRQALGQEGAISESRVYLAWLALEEGRPQEAVALATQAAGWYRSQAQPTDEASARVILGQAFLALGKLEEARAALQPALVPAREGSVEELKLGVRTLQARIDAAAGGAREAVAALEGVRDDARRLGLLNHELEAEEARGEALLRVDQPRGRTVLGEVQRRAAARGFGLVAARAGRALGRPDRKAGPSTG